MAKKIDDQKLDKTLGRWTRLGIPFRWTIGGTPVDLEAKGYTAEVWIEQPDGTWTGPHQATVAGEEAHYQLAVDDLAVASPGTGTNMRVVCVATNPQNRLVSDAREIPVGDWAGADTLAP